MVVLLLVAGAACSTGGGSDAEDRAATSTTLDTTTSPSTEVPANAVGSTTTEETTTSISNGPVASLHEVVDALAAAGLGCDPIEPGELDARGVGFEETVRCEREAPGVAVMRFPPEIHDALVDVVRAEPTCAYPQPFVDGGNWFAFAITTSAGPLDHEEALALLLPVADATGAEIAPLDTCTAP